MMRVLHIRSTNFFGGPERQILEHALAAKNLGCEIVIGTITAPGESGDFLDKAAQSAVSTCALELRSSYDWKAPARLRNWLAAQQVDVVCTHDYRSSILLALSGIRRVVPWVAFSRGLTREGFKTGLWQLVDLLLLRLADRVVAVSNGQAAVLRKYRIPSRILETIHNAASRNAMAAGQLGIELRSEFDFSDENIVVVAAGRFTAEKGQLDLVRAAASALTRNPNIRFVLFGEGPLRRECIDLVSSFGIERQVKLPGFRPNVLPYLAQADIVTNPSLSEGLPNVLLEAMSVARAVVATAVGGVPELIQDKVSGILVPASDPPRLADALVWLAADRRLRESIGQQALSRVSRDFTFEGQAEKLNALYQTVVAERSSRQKL